MSGVIANGGIGTLLGPVGDMIIEIVYSAVLNVVGPILWGLCDIFLVILDIFEMVFKKLAGIQTVKIDGQKYEGDIVLYLIRSNLVQNIFFSILFLSLCLLIIFTVVAIVNNLYADKPKPVMSIINDSCKGLLMYLLVPIATIVCLMVGNVILQAIDEATSTQTSGSASDMLFIAAAYKGNKLRAGDFEDNKDSLKYLYNIGSLNPIKDELSFFYHIESVDDIEDLEEDNGGAETIAAVANLIDEKFTGEKLMSAGKWEYFTIKEYYNSWDISMLTIWVGGSFLIWAYGKIVWGVAARLFKMTIYFAISPALMAKYPLDQGKALGAWKSDMIKNGTMAYCAIGVINILYSIIPLFLQVDIFQFDNFATAIYGQIIKVFLLIVAYAGASKLIEEVSGWFGTGNALSEGISQAGAVSNAIKTAKGKIGNVRKKAFGLYQGTRGGYAAAKKVGKGKFGRVLGGLTGAYKGSGLADALVDPTAIGKEWNDAYKAGETAYRDAATNTFSSSLNKANKALFETVDELDKLKKKIAAIGYDPATDDGSVEQVKKRKEIIASTDLGEALTKKDAIEIERHRKELSVNQRFSSLVGAVNEAEQEQKILQDQLTAVSATGDAAAMADIQAQLKRAQQRLETAKVAFKSATTSNDEIKAKAKSSNLIDDTGAILGSADFASSSRTATEAVDASEKEIEAKEEAREKKMAKLIIKYNKFGKVKDSTGVNGFTDEEFADFEMWEKSKSN